MNPEQADRASRNAALTLALALPGDTVLYLLLRPHAAAFDITLPEARLLRAANRIVRIFGYRWVADFDASRGPRAACLVAVTGAVLSCLAYAALSGLWLLLIARLIWGLAFAAMNIANQALPTSPSQAAARRVGRTRAIVAVGPMLGLLGAASRQTCTGHVQFFSAPVIALDFPGAARVPALARQAAWRDIGAAAGPLTGGLLFPVLSASAI